MATKLNLLQFIRDGKKNKGRTSTLLAIFDNLLFPDIFMLSKKTQSEAGLPMHVSPPVTLRFPSPSCIVLALCLPSHQQNLNFMDIKKPVAQKIKRLVQGHIARQRQNRY